MEKRLKEEALGHSTNRQRSGGCGSPHRDRERAASARNGQVNEGAWKPRGQESPEEGGTRCVKSLRETTEDEH